MDTCKKFFNGTHHIRRFGNNEVCLDFHRSVYQSRKQVCTLGWLDIGKARGRLPSDQIWEAA